MLFTTHTNDFILLFGMLMTMSGVVFYTLYENNKKIKNLILSLGILIGTCLFLVGTICKYITTTSKFSEHSAEVIFYKDSVVVVDSITKVHKSFTNVSEYNFLKENSNNIHISYYVTKYKFLNITYGTFGNIEKKEK